MQDHIGNIRTFDTANFRVSVDAFYDYDLDLSFDSTGETARKLESGEYVGFYVRAKVTLKSTGQELGSDSLGGCIYESIESFQDHRQCGVQNRARFKREGRFQIYRKARKHEHCLTAGDKLRKRGFATRERAEQWAKANADEAYEIMPTGVCGSYFADMIGESIREARKEFHKLRHTLSSLRVREVK